MTQSSADLFTQEVYFGAYERERTIAAGGTHALAPAHQIAVFHTHQAKGC